MNESFDNIFIILYNQVMKMKFVESDCCELKSILTKDIKKEILKKYILCIKIILD